MSKIPAPELERRRTTERGFWREMEERGLDRADVMLTDEHYVRLNEIRRGLITADDKEKSRRRVQAVMARDRAIEIADWHELQEELEG